MSLYSQHKQAFEAQMAELRKEQGIIRGPEFIMAVRQSERQRQRVRAVRKRANAQMKAVLHDGPLQVMASMGIPTEYRAWIPEDMGDAAVNAVLAALNVGIGKRSTFHDSCYR